MTAPTANATTGLLVWGAGGHGRVIADLVRATGHALTGYIDRDPAKLTAVAEPGGAVVIATEAQFAAAVSAGGPLPGGAAAVALAIGDNAARVRCLRACERAVAAALVHPSAVVSPSAAVGRGAVVLPLAVVNAGARVGDAAIVNTGAVVEHDCLLEAGVHVSPGAILSGDVVVGARSWIGSGATVIPGIRIGRDALVGAGAVVIRDVEDGRTVVGVPAAPVDRRPPS